VKYLLPSSHIGPSSTLRKYEEFKEEVLEAIEEHLQMKTLLGAIDRLSKFDDRFDAKLRVLIDDTEHRIEIGENKMFPEIEGQFSEEELEEMGQGLEAAKK
jgi:hypothetical protein